MVIHLTLRCRSFIEPSTQQFPALREQENSRATAERREKVRRACLRYNASSHSAVGKSVESGGRKP
jgi:hypothetical protein